MPPKDELISSPKPKSWVKQQTRKITELLRKAYPDAKCALTHSNDVHLLVATILSAQCTDKRVNIVTSTLFKKYKTAADFASTNTKTFEKEIKSTGFYHNKAKNIINSCKILVEKHKGRVPDSMEKLLELPGVARKTANVVLGTWFKKAVGVVVDTHVARLSQRLGLTKNEDPVKIEQDLMGCVDQRDWIDFSHMLILHGRAICNARKPRCQECVLNKTCPSAYKV
jgi:endonuclease-3